MPAGSAVAEPGVPGRSAVDPGIAAYVPVPDLKGNRVIAGSDTMQPIMLKLVSAFQQVHRGAKLGVEGGGTETALMKFISGQSGIRRGDADVGAHQVSGSVGLMASSRPLTRDEVGDGRSLPLPIARPSGALERNGWREE